MTRITRGAHIWDGSGTEVGLTTGGTRRCGIEGCQGQRVGVRWPDGALTCPCQKGLNRRADGELQIGDPVWRTTAPTGMRYPD